MKLPMLQDCFETTAWQMFREATVEGGNVDLEESTSSVLCYIHKFVEDVTITRTITIHPNQKPKLNAEVRSLLRSQDCVQGWRRSTTQCSPETVGRHK